MKNYLNLVQRVFTHGVDVDDRTGTGRRRLFGERLRFDLKEGFPLVTTRKINPVIALAETLMFIRGKTNISELNQHGINIWNAWAVNSETRTKVLQKFVNSGLMTEEQAELEELEGYEESIGEIGPMYGYLWRNWRDDSPHAGVPEPYARKLEELPSDFVKTCSEHYEGLSDSVKEKYPLEKWLRLHYHTSIDQLNELVLNLKQDPYSSRHLVTAFDPSLTPIKGFTPDENVLLQRGSLMPCHFAFQVFVNPPKAGEEKKRLSLKLSQRSADILVGMPYNIAGYALLAELLAHVTGMVADELILDFGDVHIYLDQLDKVETILSREPYSLPKLKINPNLTDLFATTLDDLEVVGYECHAAVKLPVSV